MLPFPPHDEDSWPCTREMASRAIYVGHSARRYCDCGNRDGAFCAFIQEVTSPVCEADSISARLLLRVTRSTPTNTRAMATALAAENDPTPAMTATTEARSPISAESEKLASAYMGIQEIP